MGWQPGQDLLDSLVDGAEVHLGLLKHPWVQELDMDSKGWLPGLYRLGTTSQTLHFHAAQRSQGPIGQTC
ncbi:hypothetical protein D3C75_1245810 [compost metagenome]